MSALREIIARLHRQSTTVLAVARQRVAAAAAKKPRRRTPPKPDAIRPSTESTALAAKITTRCLAAGVPEVLSRLIAGAASPAEIEAGIDNARRIKQHVAIFRKTSPHLSHLLPADAAERFIMAGATAEYVGCQLLGMLVDGQAPEIFTGHQPGGAAVGAATADHGWGKAISKATGKGEPNGAA